MEKVSEFRIEYFGKPFLKGIDFELADNSQTHSIPATLEFNSPWKIIHNCIECDNEVLFIEDSQKPERNYSIINNINSNCRNIKFLKEICRVFPRLKLIELKGVTYINRTDFDYQFDMQRTSSIELKYHNCNNCNANYLSVIRIGYPTESEKGLRDYFGCIEVDQITYVNKGDLLLQNL